MIFKKGEPWLLWPDVNAYGLDKGNVGTLFNGNNDFTISIKLDLLEIDPDKRTIYSILPTYMGFDIEGFNLSFILTTIDDNGNKIPEYYWFENLIQSLVNTYTFRYKKDIKKIEVLFDDKIIMEKTLTNTKFDDVNKTHIIFGAGNFPKNDYNLNYAEYEPKNLVISNSCLSYEELETIFNKNNNKAVAVFDFQKHTEHKVYDLTGNCNFLNKII